MLGMYTNKKVKISFGFNYYYRDTERDVVNNLGRRSQYKDQSEYLSIVPLCLHIPLYLHKDFRVMTFIGLGLTMVRSYKRSFNDPSRESLSLKENVESTGVVFVGFTLSKRLVGDRLWLNFTPLSLYDDPKFENSPKLPQIDEPASSYRIKLGFEYLMGSGRKGLYASRNKPEISI